MDSNSPPPEFTDKALNAKFSYSWTRRELIVLYGAISSIQLPVGDMRSKILRTILEEVERTAISSIGPDEYKDPSTAPIQKRSDTDKVKTS